VQAPSLLPIEGTTKCSRIARGFGCGSISGFAAEVRPKADLGFKANLVPPFRSLTSDKMHNDSCSESSLTSALLLLTIADSFYIGVLDVESATSWYIEKLGLQKVPAKMDDPEGVSRWASPKRIKRASPSSDLGTNRPMERHPCCTLPTSRRREKS
jgi:hypothetical protein